MNKEVTCDKRQRRFVLNFPLSSLRFLATRNNTGAAWLQGGDSSISAQEGTLNRVRPLPSLTRACRRRHSGRPCNPTCCRPFVNNMTHSMRPKVAASSGQSANGCVLCSLSLIHISEPTRLLSISYAVFCLKK